MDCSDTSPFLHSCVTKGLSEAFPPELRAKIAFDSLDAERYRYLIKIKIMYHSASLLTSICSALVSGQASGAEVMIVDPPRKGLDNGVLRRLNDRNANEMVSGT